MFEKAVIDGRGTLSPNVLAIVDECGTTRSGPEVESRYRKCGAGITAGTWRASP